MCGRQRWRQRGRIKARWAGNDEQTQALKLFTEYKHSRLLHPRLRCCQLPCGCPPLSGVCPLGCYSYESAAHFQRLPRAVWVGGHCPSSCLPPGLDHGPAPCLLRFHDPLPRRSRSQHHPSPDPSASLSSHLLASCPPLPAAPCAFSHVPFAALCGPKASVQPGWNKRQFSYK